MANKRKVLLIGWDGADWKVIHPLLDKGQMPALESIVDNGVIGNLATLDPPMSPMLWTSIATGMHADKHGILNFTEPAPQGAGIRPVTASSRKVKAIWNILMQEGLKTHVVGWWPSHPAEPINGVCVSNFYQRAHAPIDKPWPMSAGTVHPRSKEKIFRDLRVHPGELTAAHIMPFVPEFTKIDQEKDKRLEGLAKIISDCSTIHAAATAILENEEWDFMAVYFDAIDHFSHGYMNFHPPRMPHVPDDLFELYKGVVTGGYIYHDMMLSRLLQLAGEDVTVILVSDHGFHSDHLRPASIPREPAGPAWQHRPYGIFCMSGPGIQKDERVYGARLLDVAPTILTLYDLPIGQDMDGKPLVQAFEKSVEPEYIPSWEDVEGECGMLPENVQQDPYAEQEAMEQLIALGYIEKPDENQQKAVEKTLAETQFYLARVYINKNMYADALPILQKLYQNYDDQTRYAFHLAKCYQALGQIAESRKIVESAIEKEKETSIKRIDEEMKAGDKEKEKAEKKAIDPGKLQKMKAFRKSQIENNPQFDLLRGSLDMAEKKFTSALEFLLKAEKAQPHMPNLHQQIGQSYLRMGRLDDAERAFLKALDIDPDSFAAHDGLAQVHLRKRNHEEAASWALNAVGLLYHYPLAHYHLGTALMRMGQFDRAAQAFEVCAVMAPGFRRVHRMLTFIYYRKLNQLDKAAEHQVILDELRKQMKENKS